MFRTPTTTAQENTSFYQEEYQEGFTTEMPAPEILHELKKNLFAGSPKDFKGFSEIFKTIGIVPGDRLCDFGCSWGYGSWQFMQYGLQVQAFEISRSRAEYAKSQLGIDVVSRTADLKPPFDVFFSSHVLEHLPSVQTAIDLAWKLLRPGGYFIAATPNGSLDYRKKNAFVWQSTWGLKHPNHIDELFYKKAFRSVSYQIMSCPYDSDQIKKWALHPVQSVLNLDGEELLVIAKKLD